jgi:hypothetical protein
MSDVDVRASGFGGDRCDGSHGYTGGARNAGRGRSLQGASALSRVDDHRANLAVSSQADPRTKGYRLRLSPTEANEARPDPQRTRGGAASASPHFKLSTFVSRIGGSARPRFRTEHFKRHVVRVSQGVRATRTSPCSSASTPLCFEPQRRPIRV